MVKDFMCRTTRILQLKEGNRAVFQLTGMALDIRVMSIMLQLYQWNVPADALNTLKYDQVMTHDLVGCGKFPFQLINAD